mmetsp:Transcript_59638/g.144071  ORF Transcript_59638/g.144071 Transcript_59638/m.144071 type:complete len:107 (+) Transcript_59638:248-568(+)
MSKHYPLNKQQKWVEILLKLYLTDNIIWISVTLLVQVRLLSLMKLVKKNYLFNGLKVKLHLTQMLQERYKLLQKMKMIVLKGLFLFLGINLVHLDLLTYIVTLTLF